MGFPNLQKGVTRKAALSAGALMAVSIPSFAEDLIQTGIKAQQFAEKHNGIGIVIAYDPGDGLKQTPEEIGDWFVNIIEGKGERADYFVSIDDVPLESGASMFFAFPQPGTGTDVMAPKTAFEAIDEIIRRKRIQDELVSDGF